LCLKAPLLLLAASTCLWAYIDAEPTTGQIKSETQVDEIAVETDESPIYAVFYWDEEMELRVRVLGQTGNQLGEFDLRNGNMITLNGAGRFILDVFSENGTGNWEMELSNRNDE